MAKCDVCGKDVAFGIKVSILTDARTGLGSPISNARESSCERFPEAYLRLHPLPAFRQSDQSRLTFYRRAYGTQHHWFEKRHGFPPCRFFVLPAASGYKPEG